MNILHDIYILNHSIMKAVIIIIVLLGVISCTTTKPYVPGAANENKQTTATLAELQQGHDIYVTSCNKCHGLKSADSRTKEQWTKVLDSMAPKAKLTEEQKGLVYKYLVNH